MFIPVNCSLKPSFNYCNSLLYLELIKLPLKHKVFVSYIKFTAPVELVIAQVDEHVKIRLILQFLQKSLKYFNGAAISTFFVLPSLGIFPSFYLRFE